MVNKLFIVLTMLFLGISLGIKYNGGNNQIIHYISTGLLFISLLLNHFFKGKDNAS